jgi:hypothetical protein
LGRVWGGLRTSASLAGFQSTVVPAANISLRHEQPLATDRREEEG